MEHGKLLSRKFLSPRRRGALGYGEMHEVDAGGSHGDDVSHLPDTQGPREEEVSFLQVHGGCSALHSADGEHVGGWQLWELRFEADGTYHWELRV